jgi:outer membrane protein assembly factor BamB
MTTTQETVRRKPLRLWPAIAIAIIVLALKFVVPVFSPALSIYGVLGAVTGAALVLVWWLLFSRAPWVERVGAIVVLAVAAVATWFLVDPSIRGGFMGRMLAFLAIPVTFVPAFVAWAVMTRHLSDRVRRLTMVATIAVACLVWTLARTDGVIGEAGTQLHWRWTPTAEERLLAKGEDEPKPLPAAPAAEVPQPAAEKPSEPPVAPAVAPAAAAKTSVATATAAPNPVRVKKNAEWPGFLGPGRDAVVRGVAIETDWSQKPPAELWRRPIGPGWSSFAVDGDLFYTQEQRGEHEVVTCYRVSTGEPVWRHRDSVRFYESNGGPGPRGTPAVSNGRVFALGATGILNALDEKTGAVVWSRNAATDTGAPMPGWGFTASPVVVDDLLVVATSGRLGAFDSETGQPRWTYKTGGSGYSSPHVVTIDGVTQIVLLSGRGATSVAPKDGALLWDHQWDIGTAIVQPVVLPGGDILVALCYAMAGQGIRRLAISRGASGWTAHERWTSRGLKPYFNHFVVHKGHAFGFDGSILSSINVETGERNWKGGRYGQGQMLLLPDQDLLLIISEDGELALVSATADQYKEIAKFKAIDGKTWNHPVLVRDVLLVRNGEEMAAFRLTTTRR